MYTIYKLKEKVYIASYNIVHHTTNQNGERFGEKYLRERGRGERIHLLRKYKKLFLNLNTKIECGVFY